MNAQRSVKRRSRSGAPRLFVHGVTVEAWTKRWGLQPFSAPCYKCKRTCTTTLPFVQGTLIGLQAPPCECGHPTPPFSLMRNPKYGDLFDGSLAE